MEPRAFISRLDRHWLFTPKMMFDYYVYEHKSELNYCPLSGPTDYHFDTMFSVIDWTCITIRACLLTPRHLTNNNTHISMGVISISRACCS